MLRIKQLRQEKNLSQRALADKLGVSQKAIDLWEKSITTPKAQYVCALADLFECSADYIIGREDDTGAVNVMRELDQNEKELLNIYSKLNKKEQDELLDFAKYLLYKKG